MKSRFGIVLVAEIMGLAATARTVDFGDISTPTSLAGLDMLQVEFNILNRQTYESRSPITGAKNPEADIVYSAAEQSPTSPEAQPFESSVLRLLITAIVFVTCILIVGAALRKHKCCCGRKKFP